MTDIKSLRPLPEQVRGLVDAFLTLYCGTREEVVQVTSALYSEDAEFEDPLVRVKGRHQVQAQFVALKGLFVSATCYDVEVDFTEPDSQGATPNNNFVIIKFTVLYRLSRLLADTAVPIRQVSRLQFGQGGLIERHFDEWNNPVGYLACLPRPLRGIYDTARSVLGSSSSSIVRFTAKTFDALHGPVSRAGQTIDDKLVSKTGADLSLMGIATALFDLRGSSSYRAHAESFKGANVVVIGEFDEVLARVALMLKSGGASSVHLVSRDAARTQEVADMLRNAPIATGTRQFQIVPHTSNFARKEEVTLWCWTMRQLLVGQGSKIDVIVLGSIPPTAVSDTIGAGNPSAGHREFHHEQDILEFLLSNLQPSLADRARIVVTASGSSQWLPQANVDCRAGDEADDAVHPALYPALQAIQARALREASKVAFAARRGREWFGLPAGVDCVSCTPGGSYSAWAEIFSCAAETWPVQTVAAVARYVPGWRRVWTKVQGVLASHAAGTILQLSNRSHYVSPGAYYWGQHHCLGADAILRQNAVAEACSLPRKEDADTKNGRFTSPRESTNSSDSATDDGDSPVRTRYVTRRSTEKALPSNVVVTPSG